MPLPLKILVHGKLTEQHNRHLFGTVTLLATWGERRARSDRRSGDVTDDPPGGSVSDDGDA